MVSQRQRMARKRFKEANPHLFPKPEPPSEDAGSKKKKKKIFRKTLKRGVAKPGSGRGSDRFTGSKHPLRIPGWKPGEACFVCNANDHIAKACPQKAEWEKNKICLLCRRRGHSLKNCPDKGEDSDKKLCYNCGEIGHSLNRCPQPLQDGGAKFASCFICNQQGHLSKNCPKNTHGIYPKGGCCKLCGGVTHLARDCPEKGSRGAAAFGSETGDHPKTWQGSRAVFRSGDDLEDDFIVDEGPPATKKPKIPNLEVDLVASNVDAKRKKGPKVVNFLG
ncbi:unnamed protein product [Spirodela intermedia]|uniref:CCHC-type domain-containing protein n=1 Tax=Spirodela intermedia TaxID=51605 RepID=A0A7I8KPQ8_SPIIN|nr:unnamed protein product [Spirodela intermedia]